MSEMDYEALDQLIGNGFTLQDSFQLLRNDQNTICLDQIKEKLEKGEELTTFIQKYVPSIYRNYLSSFLLYLPFHESLHLSIVITQEQTQQTKEIQKNLTYPLLMFLASTIGIFLFNRICFPPMISMMSGFKVDYSSLLFWHHLIDIGLFLFLLLLGIVCCLTFYFTRESKQTIGYLLIHRYLHWNTLLILASNDFIRFFYQCVKMELKTKDSLAILKSMKGKPLVCFLAFHIEQSLLKGMTMEEAMKNPYLDSNLGRFFTIAIYSSNMLNMLEGYIKLNQLKMIRKCKVITKTIQAVTYVAIGIVLIFIYQILLSPLSIMSQM